MPRTDHHRHVMANASRGADAARTVSLPPSRRTELGTCVVREGSGIMQRGSRQSVMWRYGMRSGVVVRA